MSEGTYRPMSDNVLVRVPKKETMTSGGLHIPESADQGKPQHGVAVAIGPGRRLETGELLPMLIVQNQEVLFGQYAGIPVEINKVEYLVIRQDDILLAKEEANAQDAVG